MTNSLVPRHGRRGEFRGLHKSMKFEETRKPHFSGFELKKSTDGLFLPIDAEIAKKGHSGTGTR